MRCVVVLPEGGDDADAPPSLISGLSRRGMAVIVSPGPARAMLHLARSPSAAMVVVDPDQVADVTELVEAVQTYHPSVVCWRYERREPSDVGRLTAMDRGGLPPESRGPGQGIADRLEKLVNRVNPPADPPSPLITEEELAMLLDDRPADPTRHGEKTSGR